MSWIANIVYLLGGLIYLPFLCYAMIAQGKNRRGWGEKLFGPRAGLRSVGRRRIWVHAVSLGEVNACRGIVAGLEQRRPDCDVLISTTTDTGYARACELFGTARVFRYPLDFTWAVRRALRRIDPALIVLVELEVWYNLATMAAKRGVPVCVVNGRLTERSCRRLRRVGWLVRPMFAALRWAGVQDAATADRFAAVGVARERITVLGSVKWDTASVAERIPGQDELAAAVGIDPDRPLWVCGSTGVAEEALLLDAYAAVLRSRPALQLAIVPRKPERFDEVAHLIAARGFARVRRSACPDGAQVAVGAPAGGVGAAGATDDGSGRRVILGDTMGELRKLYALATVVFVGRSLVPMGGSDPMEVAALGRPIVVGPYMDNFAGPTRALVEGGALVQADSAEAVAEQVERWLADPGAAATAGAAGRRVVLENQGATERTVERLSQLLA